MWHVLTDETVEEEYPASVQRLRVPVPGWLRVSLLQDPRFCLALRPGKVQLCIGGQSVKKFVV